MQATTPHHVVSISSHGDEYYESSAESAADMIANGCRFVRMEWPKYAWPGGYPIFYVTPDGGCLCPDCANDNLNLTFDGADDWRIVATDINYENTALYCDHCGGQIEPAYGEDEA